MEQATRLILEFGTELPSGYTEAAPFCRLSEVRRGSAAAPLPQSLRSGTLGQLVRGIELRTLKGGDGDGDGDGERRSPSPSRAAAKGALPKRYVALVTWAEALRLPPLELRFAPSLADCWPTAPSTATPYLATTSTPGRAVPQGGTRRH